MKKYTEEELEQIFNELAQSPSKVELDKVTLNKMTKMIDKNPKKYSKKIEYLRIMYGVPLDKLDRL